MYLGGDVVYATDTIGHMWTQSMNQPLKGDFADF